MVSWSLQWTERTFYRQSCRIRHRRGGGGGGAEEGPMQTRSALKEFFLEREQQRQDENSPSCFLLETCCGKSHPSQICQEGSFEITDKDTGSEVPRITSYVNQSSIGNGRGPPSDVSDLEPVHTLRSPSFPHSLWSEGGILPCGWQSTQVICFFEGPEAFSLKLSVGARTFLP